MKLCVNQLSDVQSKSKRKNCIKLKKNDFNIEFDKMTSEAYKYFRLICRRFFRVSSSVKLCWHICCYYWKSVVFCVKLFGLRFYINLSNFLRFVTSVQGATNGCFLYASYVFGTIVFASMFSTNLGAPLVSSPLRKCLRLLCLAAPGSCICRWVLKKWIETSRTSGKIIMF